jgi:hypothetical protein
MIENNSETQNRVSIEDILTALDELSETLVDRFGKKTIDKSNEEAVNNTEPF